MEKFADLAIYCDKNLNFHDKNGYMFLYIQM